MDKPQQEESTVGYLALIRENPNFRNLWFGQIVSLLGDWFNLIASAALVARLTGSGLAIGGLFIVRFLAPFFISPLAGVITDRYNRKHILILTDISRALIVFAFLFVRDPEDVWLLYFLTILQLGISGIFFPARSALLPDLVAPKELGTANALSSTTWSVMLAVGAALGGLIAGGWGIYPAFAIDAVTFLVSAVFIARIHYHPPGISGERDVRSTTMLSEYVDGLRFLIKKVDLLWISLHKAAWGLIAGGMFSVLIVQLSKDVFPIGEAGGITLGLLYAVAGIGTGIGPILARRFTGDREIPVRAAIGLSYFITSAGLIIASLLSSLGVVLLGNFIRAFGGGIIWVFSTMLLFVLVPERFRGRVLSTEFAFFTLASALGAALGGWVIDQSSITFHTILLWTGLVSIIPGLLWFLWIRSRGDKSKGDAVQQMEEPMGFPEPVPSPPHRPHSEIENPDLL